MKRLPLAVAAASILATPALAQSQGETTASIYLWGTAVTERLINGREIEVDFETILDNLDFALMGEIVHRRGPWIYGFEGFFADISGGQSAQFPITPGEPDDFAAIDVFAGVDTTTLMAYGFGGYELVRNDSLQLYGTGGLRYTQFDTDLTVDTANRSFTFNTKDELWDVVVGLRGQFLLDSNWSIPFIVDVGTGSSDLTYQLFGGLSYAFGNSVLTVGYRQMVWDIGSGAEVTDKYDYSGPLLAFSYRF
jgi:hypothetical protein